MSISESPVLLPITLLEITDHNSSLFGDLWNIYQSVFPEDEKRTLKQQIELLAKQEYSLQAITQSSVVIGLLASWQLYSCVFIDHLAISTNSRSNGIGSRVLSLFIRQKTPPIVLEVEDKYDSDEGLKRIRFYERLGFSLNDFPYFQPPISPGKEPVNMKIMSYPKGLSENEYLAIRNDLYTKVYNFDATITD